MMTTETILPIDKAIAAYHEADAGYQVLEKAAQEAREKSDEAHALRTQVEKAMYRAQTLPPNLFGLLQRSDAGMDIRRDEHRDSYTLVHLGFCQREGKHPNTRLVITELGRQKLALERAAFGR